MSAVHRLWKRNGVAGMYVVEVERGDPDGDARVRVRPLYHCWSSGVLANPRARWVKAWRLRPLTAHDRQELARRILVGDA